MSHAISVCHGAFGRATLYRLDKPIITHAHREGHLIFLFGGEAAQLKVGDEVCPLDDDFGVAISPWEPHSFHPPEGRETLCLTLYIKPMWFLENSVSAEFALSFGSSSLRLTPKLRELVRRLTAFLMDDDPDLAFDGLLYDLTRASFEQSWSTGDRDRLLSARERFSDFRVRRSLRLMQSRVCQDMEMETLAREVGLSRPHFFKLFKKQMGVTPNIYLNTLRSEQAIEDLLTTEKTVTDIAFDLGFSSQASFTRFFSSNVGISPSEYRRVAHT